MKKSVIIAILLIYIGSIFAVNFFGLKMKIFEGTEYVTKIECIGVELEREKDNKVVEKEKEDGVMGYYIRQVGGTFSENDTTNTNVVKINYRVYPDNATNGKIDLVYDAESINGKVIVKEESLEVVFLRKCGIYLTLKAIDGSNVETIIYIEAS